MEKIFDDPDDKFVDIYAEPDIKLTVGQEMKKNKNIINFIVDGKDNDYSICNAVRRAILLYVPVYGFHESGIKISHNTSIYYSDMICQNIMNMPIPNIENKYDLESPNDYLSTDVLRELFSNFLPQKRVYLDENDQTEKEPPKPKQLQVNFFLNVSNNTNDIMWVGSHDGKLFIDGVESKNFLKEKNMYLFLLRNGQSIELKATANLGIPLIHSCYEATTNCIYKQLSPTKYEFVSKSLGQLAGIEILRKSLVILYKKLDNLRDYIKSKNITESSNHLVLELHNEDETLGNLVSSGLQRCKDVDKAGYCKPHFITRSIRIEFMTKNGIKPTKILIDIIKYLQKIINKMMDGVNN